MEFAKESLAVGSLEVNFYDGDSIEQIRLIREDQHTDEYAERNDSSWTHSSNDGSKGKKISARMRQCMALTRKAVLIVLAFCITMDLITKLLYAIQQTRSCSCGTSIAEALSKNCVFDPLVPAWVPPHCRDDDLTEEFRHQGPAKNGFLWPFYSAMENGTRLTEDEVALLADVPNATFYSTHEFHVAHCFYSWLKAMRAPQRWLVEPRRTRGEFHVRHCHSVVKNPVSMDRINEGIPAGLFALNADLVKAEDRNHH